MIQTVNITRHELYEKVWKTPMRKLASEFGLSDGKVIHPSPDRRPEKIAKGRLWPGGLFEGWPLWIDTSFNVSETSDQLS